MITNHDKRSFFIAEFETEIFRFEIFGELHDFYMNIGNHEFNKVYAEGFAMSYMFSVVFSKNADTSHPIYLGSRDVESSYCYEG